MNSNDHIDSGTADGAQGGSEWDAWKAPPLASGVAESGPASSPFGTKARSTLYPSFYAAVHRAVNVDPGVLGPYCIAPESPYNANDHACYDLAAALRVELHAAGIRLSTDGKHFGNGSSFEHTLESKLGNESEIRDAIARAEAAPARLGEWQRDPLHDDSDSVAYVRYKAPIAPEPTLWERFLRAVIG